jgi:ribosome-binding ATPase
MPVNIALIGADGSGKTTLFNALTHGRGADGVGMVDVPDARLYRLADAVHPKKVVHAQVRLTDAPPGSKAQRIASAREADVVVMVVRCFGPDPDPAAEVASVEVDLAVTDLTTVERRLEAVEKEVRTGRKAAGEELEVLRRAREQLDNGLPLRALDLTPEQRAFLEPLFPVSLKPVVLVANSADSLLPGGGDVVKGMPPGRIVISAQLELELAELDPESAAEMRSSYGLDEGSLDRLARAVWDAGGLITYFTAGEPEVRAWPCPKDAPAPIAAGVIHSDFEKHFIRAEVTSVDELVAAGSMEALRAAGRLRVEGREYYVKDGDVVFFRIGR